MSTHAIPSPSSDAGDSLRWQRLDRLRDLCRLYLRAPEGVTDDGATLSIVFTPDLTAGQLTILARLIAISGIGLVTPAEYAAVQPDLATCQTFLGMATPTLAQTAAGTKSLIRALGILLRN